MKSSPVFLIVSWAALTLVSGYSHGAPGSGFAGRTTFVWKNSANGDSTCIEVDEQTEGRNFHRPAKADQCPTFDPQALTQALDQGMGAQSRGIIQRALKEVTSYLLDSSDPLDNEPRRAPSAAHLAN